MASIFLKTLFLEVIIFRVSSDFSLVWKVGTGMEGAKMPLGRMREAVGFAGFVACSRPFPILTQLREPTQELVNGRGEGRFPGHGVFLFLNSGAA